MLYTRSEILELCFWDLETKPAKLFNQLDNHLQDIWLDKYHTKYVERDIQLKQKDLFLKSIKEETGTYLTPSQIPITEVPTIEYIYEQYSPLHAEFGAIMCISMGIFILEDNKLEREIITFQDNEEKNILLQFSEFLNSPVGKRFKLAGYNIREFDIPFATKRFLINKMQLPCSFMLKSKKPWEISITDVCDDWRGLQREIVGLDLVCTSLGLPTPKDKFKNSEVVRLFLSGAITAKDVAEYCEKDIHAVMDVVETLLIVQ